MPWTIDDVEKHNKGLTDAQKKQWVKVANSVLKSCTASGKPEDECDALAIKQANAVVKHQASTNVKIPLIANVKYDVRRDTHKGKSHVIVPVVMMTEGVHNGSHGPMLYLAEEFGKCPESWNGVPIVVFHPEENGCYISANAPHVLDRQEIGRVFNVRVEDKKLRGDAWINEADAMKVDPRILDHINCFSELEVSIGAFTDDEFTMGTWGSEDYIAIVRNPRPDHLALLPGGVGACSWADGCGIRANNATEIVTNEEANMDKDTKDCVTCPKKIELLVQSAHSPYKEEDREFLATLSENRLDQLVLMNDTISTKKQEITALVEEKERMKPVELTKEQMLQVLAKEGGLEIDQFMSLLKPELKEHIQSGLYMQANRKKELVGRITANSKAFTQEELDLKSISELEKISSLIPDPVDYTGMAGGSFITNAQSVNDVLLPVGVEIKQ